jgi:glycosyltransferase involved in cell wall biosynthesis
MVRPTRSDGDALSIREALHAAVPVVASDVVERPEGTLTFPLEDIGALSATLGLILDDGMPEKDSRGARKGSGEGDSFNEGVIRIYRAQLALEAEERSRLPAGG